ncbi:MAG: hypothetical protein ABIP56_02540, partial [Dokdonella sp.]
MNNVNLNTRRFNRYAGNAGLAALVVAASMTIASTQAMAAVVCFNTPIPVPATTAGVYVNLFTGATGLTAAGTADWDFNPWAGTSGTLLNLFSPGAPQGHVSSGGVISNLPTGTLVDGTSTYTASASSATAMGTYRAGVNPGYLGVRFAQAGVTYFAWVSMTTASPGGIPATINNWCFENTAGTGITVGTT